MTSWTYEDIYDRLTPLYVLLSRLPYEPDFVLPHPEPAPAPSNWGAYWAGVNFALRPSMTVFCILCVNL
jgi:hypothetical protein